MGLKSLQKKISESVTNSDFNEKDIVYLIVEIRKYIERSEKNLGDPEDIKVYPKKFQTIRFFRNWISHPEKHSTDLSAEVDTLLTKLETDESAGVALEQMLVDEIKTFCSDTNTDFTRLENLDGTRFFQSLREILHEQPIQRNDGKVIGYDDNLKLVVF